MARETPEYSNVHISTDQIPEIVEPMPVLRLGAPAIAPQSLIEEVVHADAPGIEFVKLGDTGAQAAYHNDRMVAFQNPQTGETRVFPLLEPLKPGQRLADLARSAAGRIVRNEVLFPRDGTEAVVLTPVSLAGARRLRDGGRTAASEFLSYVRVQRRVNGAPVFGPGTRAMLAVRADGDVCGISHRWRPAAHAGDSVSAHPRSEIAKSIAGRLVSFARNADVTVDSVTIGYYDGGRDVLQPIYRFQATIVSHQKVKAANRRVSGFVSIGAEVEPLPVLGIRKGEPPVNPPAYSERQEPAPGDPTVGRYVVRNDSDEWTTSANEFMGSLSAAQNFFHGPIPFTNNQFYWAEPRLFLNEKNSFVNSVHIALNEVHGNWSWFSTRDNNDDGVSLSDIPSSGYGGGGGGSLAYWIIHSCEVIPTQTDESNSFDVWWNIFNGLHAVVSYRTEMWIDDDVMGPFGLWIGIGAPVVSAWLNEVATNDSYDDGDTYHDGNRGIDEPMGRASAVAVCGHGDDIASNVGSLGRANCLTEWWFEN